MPLPPTPAENEGEAVKTRRKRVSDTYFALVKRFPLVPIQDDDHLDEATEILHELIARDLDASGEAYVDVLTDLVEAYETATIPHGPPVPPDRVLKEMLYQHRLSQAELARQTGIAQSTLSAICLGARKPTVEHAKILGERFKLKPETFLGL